MEWCVSRTLFGHQYSKPWPINMDAIVQAANPDLAGNCDMCIGLLSGLPAAEKIHAYVASASQVWVGGLNNLTLRSMS